MEDASRIEEVSTPVATLDSVICQELIDLPTPKISVSSTGATSVHMEQMLLLGKMDVHRLMKNPENKCDCHTHELQYCGCLIKLPWKVKGSYNNKEGGGVSHHAAHAGRHLENTVTKNALIPSKKTC